MWNPSTGDSHDVFGLIKPFGGLTCAAASAFHQHVVWVGLTHEVVYLLLRFRGRNIPVEALRRSA